MPKPTNINNTLIDDFDFVKEIISGVRNIRNDKNIPNKEKLSLKINAVKSDKNIYSIIKKLANISDIEFVNKKVEGAVSFIVGTTEFYVPLGNLINVDEEIKKLEDELKYQQGFLKSVEKKLSNERFVNNAPQKVVDNEKQKMKDAVERITAIKNQIENLKK